MAAPMFIHLTINMGSPPIVGLFPIPDDERKRQLKERLDKALDWVNYDVNSYILYTTRDHQFWYTYLKPLIAKDGVLFLCKIDITQRQGWVSKTFWNWVKSKQSTIPHR